MNFKKSKLYKTIVNGTPEVVMKALWDYLKSGKDVNLKDETTGESLLHLLVRHGERFCTPETIQAIYMLVCKDVDIDAQDHAGETALHIVMRKKGTYRIMMAIVRCGIDTAITNNDGKTAEEVLLTEKPDGWQEMLHWYNKYKPGLWRALSVEEPDRKLVEKLLKNWCRLTCIKDGKVTSIKSLVKEDVRKIDLLHMIEEYENANEMALALNAGFGFIVKSWIKQGTDLVKSVDPNTSDYSYQYNYPDSPEVPRPLLAAAWETNSYDTVDVLMDMNPNTRALYSNEPDTVNPPKPLFFQLVCGNSIPADDRILLRIFRGSDLQARDRDGQTILHKVIEHQKPENTFRILMTYGADIAARDRQGRTARDLALKLNRPEYSTCVDEHIIKLVKDKKFDDIERLILQSYDQLLNVTDSAKRTMVEIAKKYGNRQIYEVIKLSAAIQAYVRRVFQAVAEDQMEDLKKLLSCKKYHNVRDKCGRTLLHKAVMKKRYTMVKFLIEEFPQNLNVGDTMDRTPLHYAYLFCDESVDTITVMVNNGANAEFCDAFGMRPSDMTAAKCGSQKLAQIQKDVTDLEFNIYLSEKDFLASFSSAIQKGDLETVKSLVSGLRAFGDMSQFSKSLFECIDHNQIEIAKFLIMAGFKTDIYKQYTSCDPDDPMCAMMECGHSMTSLKERATEKKCDDIVTLIEGISNGKVKLARVEPQNGLGEYGI